MPSLPSLPDLLIPHFSDFLYTLSTASHRIVFAFSFVGNSLATRWSFIIQLLFPPAYDFLFSFENSVLRFVPFYSIWLWIFNVDSLLHLTFLHIITFGILFFLIWKFFTWVLNIVT